MSYKDVSQEDLVEVRKTFYDQLWHVVYRVWDRAHVSYRTTYDRVSQATAIKVSKTLSV